MRVGYFFLGGEKRGDVRKMKITTWGIIVLVGIVLLILPSAAQQISIGSGWNQFSWRTIENPHLHGLKDQHIFVISPKNFSYTSTGPTYVKVTDIGTNADVFIVSEGSNVLGETCPTATCDPVLLDPSAAYVSPRWSHRCFNIPDAGDHDIVIDVKNHPPTPGSGYIMVGKGTCPDNEMICEGQPVPLCPAGTFSPDGKTPCTPCPAGSISTSAGATTCMLCPTGSYSESPGSSVCTLCPAGTSSGITGATVCTSCPDGQYQPDTGATECSSCPGANGVGNTICEPVINTPEFPAAFFPAVFVLSLLGVVLYIRDTREG